MRKETVRLRVSSQHALRPGVGLRPVSASVDTTRDLERSRYDCNCVGFHW